MFSLKWTYSDDNRISPFAIECVHEFVVADSRICRKKGQDYIKYYTQIFFGCSFLMKKNLLNLLTSHYGSKFKISKIPEKLRNFSRYIPI